MTKVTQIDSKNKPIITRMPSSRAAGISSGSVSRRNGVVQTPQPVANKKTKPTYANSKKTAFVSPVKAMQSPLKTATKAMIEHQVVKTVISLAEDSIIIQAPAEERRSP